jgi:hydroxymethylbilane synthase
VDTRLRKVDSGELDAVILAAAGLNRLGHGDRVTRLFSRDEMVPAVGQGAIAIETRRDHAEMISLLARMQDERARREIDAERHFLVGLGGSCTTPLGIHAEIAGDHVVLRGFLSSVDGSVQIRDRVEGPAADAPKLADELLDRFTRAGAAGLLGRS